MEPSSPSSNRQEEPRPSKSDAPVAKGAPLPAKWCGLEAEAITQVEIADSKHAVATYPSMGFPPTPGGPLAKRLVGVPQPLVVLGGLPLWRTLHKDFMRTGVRATIWSECAVNAYNGDYVVSVCRRVRRLLLVCKRCRM